MKKLILVLLLIGLIPVNAQAVNTPEPVWSDTDNRYVCPLGYVIEQKRSNTYGEYTYSCIERSFEGYGVLLNLPTEVCKKAGTNTNPPGYFGCNIFMRPSSFPKVTLVDGVVTCPENYETTKSFTRIDSGITSYYTTSIAVFKCKSKSSDVFGDGPYIPPPTTVMPPTTTPPSAFGGGSVPPTTDSSDVVLPPTTQTPPPVSCPEPETIYKDKIVYQDRIVYQDKIIYKENFVSEYMEEGYLVLPRVDFKGNPALQNVVFEFMADGSFRVVAVEAFEE